MRSIDSDEAWTVGSKFNWNAKIYIVNMFHMYNNNLRILHSYIHNIHNTQAHIHMMIIIMKRYVCRSVFVASFSICLHFLTHSHHEWFDRHERSTIRINLIIFRSLPFARCGKFTTNYIEFFSHSGTFEFGWVLVWMDMVFCCCYCIIVAFAIWSSTKET